MSRAASVSAVVDTSVLIDVLRGVPPAVELLADTRASGPLGASVITRVEVLAGMRPEEEDATRALLATLRWHPLDDGVVEEAGALGRRWLTTHGGIDSADLVIAATARRLAAPLYTRNLRHFPMFADLVAPY